MLKGESFKLPVEIENTGNSKWISNNLMDIGVVKLGIHLYNGNDLIDLDFYKKPISRDVMPGEKTALEAEIKLDTPGEFNLVFDLVSERICWFEQSGCKTIQVIAKVT